LGADNAASGAGAANTGALAKTTSQNQPELCRKLRVFIKARLSSE
jgi:hypothetical protein